MKDEILEEAEEANRRLAIRINTLVETLEVIKVVATPPHHENALNAIRMMAENTLKGEA